MQVVNASGTCSCTERCNAPAAAAPYYARPRSGLMVIPQVSGWHAAVCKRRGASVQDGSQTSCPAAQALLDRAQAEGRRRAQQQRTWMEADTKKTCCLRRSSLP